MSVDPSIRPSVRLISSSASSGMTNASCMALIFKPNNNEITALNIATDEALGADKDGIVPNTVDPR